MELSDGFLLDTSTKGVGDIDNVEDRHRREGVLIIQEVRSALCTDPTMAKIDVQVTMCNMSISCDVGISLQVHMKGSYEIIEPVTEHITIAAKDGVSMCFTFTLLVGAKYRITAMSTTNRLRCHEFVLIVGKDGRISATTAYEILEKGITKARELLIKHGKSPW